MTKLHKRGQNKVVCLKRISLINISILPQPLLKQGLVLLSHSLFPKNNTLRKKMAKVHPNAPSASIEPLPINTETKEEITLTVWRKSLLLNCKGFTVYDSTGDLTFRVDAYSAKNRATVLMDATGRPLFTIKRKRMSLGLGDNWVIYRGEETNINPPLFSSSKHVTLRQSKWLALVVPCGGADPRRLLQRYSIEGSYSQRCCTVYDEQQRKAVAEVQRKESAAPGVTWGGDVFRLVVRSGFDASLAMAIVLLLDQMFGC